MHAPLCPRPGFGEPGCAQLCVPSPDGDGTARCLPVPTGLFPTSHANRRTLKPISAASPQLGWVTTQTFPWVWKSRVSARGHSDP